MTRSVHDRLQRNPVARRQRGTLVKLWVCIDHCPACHPQLDPHRAPGRGNGDKTARDCGALHLTRAQAKARRLLWGAGVQGDVMREHAHQRLTGRRPCGAIQYM